MSLTFEDLQGISVRTVVKELGQAFPEEGECEAEVKCPGLCQREWVGVCVWGK